MFKDDGLHSLQLERKNNEFKSGYNKRTEKFLFICGKTIKTKQIHIFLVFVISNSL